MMALVLAVAVVLSMSVTVFADPETPAATKTSVTINSANSETGSVYKGYKLMTAVPDNAANPTKYTYTVNPTYKSAVLTALNLAATASDKAIYDAIAALDNDGIEKFADDMFNALGNSGGDATLNEGAATDLDYGYWLIYESTVGTLPDGESVGTYTKVLLDTYAKSPAVTVTTKESYPTPDKEIVDSSLDSDSDTVAVGDTVTYKISATLPSNVAKYKEKGYKLVFTDTMSKGLTFKSISSVKIDTNNGQKSTASDSYYYTEGTAKSGDDTVLTVTFDNIINGLTDEQIAAIAGKKVEITYTVEINADAVTGSSGNPNTVKITYSNDPYSNGTGESTEIENKVYTFKLTLNKTDGTNPLEGAGFTLYKADGSVVGEIAAAAGKTSFEWDKLDAGSYKIVETTVPDGYTKCDDIEFEITATASDTDDSLTSVTVDNQLIDVDGSFNLTTTVVNNAGTTLPSTGGIGTTIFYVVGALLVIGAGVLLVTRRRMRAE